MALHDTKLVDCLALGTHRHHRSSERSGIVALLNLSQGIVIEHVTISNQSHSPVLYLLLLAFFFVAAPPVDVPSFKFSADGRFQRTQCCTQQVASQSLVPPEPFVFLVADSDVVFFESTVSAAIFAFSTRPSLLCSEPFQLFSNQVRNFFFLHKSRSLNAIQRRHPESNRGLEQSTLVLVPLIVVDLATNVTLVIFLAPPGCSAGYGTSAIICSTGSSIASLDSKLDRLGVLVTRAGDCNKTDTVTVILK